MMERYRFSEAELRHLEQLPMPMAVYQFVDRHVYTLALSDGYCELFGYMDKAEAYRQLNRDVMNNTHPDDVARVEDAIRRFINEGGRYEVIFRARKNRGQECRVIHGIGRHVYRENGVRLAYVAFTDEGEYTGDYDHRETALNRAFNKALHEESLLKSTHFDELTGLPNMMHFFELAEAEKNAVVRDGGVAALMYMDLNGMKAYNDSYGYAEGDRLLRAFAQCLGRVFGRQCCCRINADRFLAYAHLEELEGALQRLFREVGAMNGGKTLPIRVGIYLSSQGIVSPSAACDRAKLACDAIPKSHASSFRYYDDGMRRDARRRQYILSQFDAAIREKRIQVYYQPIVRAVTEKVCDEEALARWIDPVEGFLSPADFIPTLEEAGLIYRLDLFVLEQVLEKMKHEASEGLHIVPHSVNLSRSDFDACDIVEEIRERVDASGVGRDKITIEITESVLGSNFDFMKEQVKRFRALGFQVWMDDFGSGYSSLDVLQSIRFDLLKFDMSFMRKLEDSDSSRILLTELMRMANALGLDTVCEGVETERQARFLQEIGCSKIQGYYYCKPIPYEQILERNRTGRSISYENPEETAYYETIGRVNLYDLSVITSGEADGLQNSYSTIPMGIIEVRGDSARFFRSNQSYRDFIKRFFGLNLTQVTGEYVKYGAAFMNGMVKACCDQGLRLFFDEVMPDGSVVHSLARRIGVNPVTETAAVAIAVLSITEPNEGATYADIARAMAADYYNIYVIDLDTERFIEYTSPAGAEELALERHGEDFFASARRETMTRIYEEDREPFLANFSKEKVIRELDAQGVYTATYRLMDTGTPMYVNMKVTRMHPHGNRIIMGISVVDAQMREKEAEEKARQQNIMFGRIAALAGEYYAMYIVDPETGRYCEYDVTSDYSKLGYDKEGNDFFEKARIDVHKHACPEDLAYFLEHFTKEKVMRDIREKGVYRIRYRLMINGEPRPILLKVGMVHESDGEKIVVGVNVADDAPD